MLHHVDHGLPKVRDALCKANPSEKHIQRCHVEHGWIRENGFNPLPRNGFTSPLEAELPDTGQVPPNQLLRSRDNLSRHHGTFDEIPYPLVSLSTRLILLAIEYQMLNQKKLKEANFRPSDLLTRANEGQLFICVRVEVEYRREFPDDLVIGIIN